MQTRVIRTEKPPCLHGMQKKPLVSSDRKEKPGKQASRRRVRKTTGSVRYVLQSRAGERASKQASKPNARPLLLERGSQRRNGQTSEAQRTPQLHAPHLGISISYTTPPLDLCLFFFLRLNTTQSLPSLRAGKCLSHLCPLELLLLHERPIGLGDTRLPHRRSAPRTGPPAAARPSSASSSFAAHGGSTTATATALGGAVCSVWEGM